MIMMTKEDASTRNDSETRRTETGKIRGICSGPVRYELIDSTGFVRGPFKSAADAMSYATKRWPDQTQDPDRTGRGWDVQVVGSR